uniref:Uncharacterized protein n=1 Tax=Aegilops tauschii subsp. strangulata TaxID=200361 RepID=A0A453S0D8_AEGTS
MPPISLGDISSFVRTTDPDDFGLHFNIVEANGCTKAGALIINTFDALEADVLAALRAEYPRIYTVGPLGSLLNHQLRGDDDASASGLSLWKQDTECLAWLDTQQPGSVVDNLVPGAGAGVSSLPAEFIAATAGRCCLTTWCPQDRVLGHPARGVLPDAQRVELHPRERGGRRADGVLAGVRGPVHQLQVRLRCVGRGPPG